MSQDQQADKPPEGQVAKGVGVGAGGTVVGGGLVAALLAPQYRTPIIIFLAVSLVLVLVAGGLFLWLRSRRRKANAGNFGSDVTGEFDRQAASTNDPEVKARLEKVKRKFMLLIETLKKEGQKNVYEIPWFLTLGPSGSGKSWVLKGSGLEPLDETDWKRGTFLIDWWSCPEALVLDTAGGVVFQEERGYDSPEWQSLLKLLKKHRPQCPINGLLVIVPAQLLWLNEDELPAGWLSLDDYANALRVQIRKRLQRELGIRFPVYFIVTQCDRLPGFREFADTLEASKNPKGQILGWSLPVEVGKKSLHAGVDGQAFPELAEIGVLDERLRSVSSDLRHNRLSLIRPYVGDGARADELGMGVRRRAADLFNFPDTIQGTLAPRLKELLTKVFKPDPTLPKLPPYLRGVYFTSSLREGEVLHRQGTGLGSKLADLALPGGADSEQLNPFFLKDLIFEKAFPESWLITPLVEARAYLNQRRRALIFSGIIAGLLFLTAIVVGGFAYQRTVGSELNKWTDASEAAKKSRSPDLAAANRYWLPVVKSLPGGGVEVDKSNLIKQLDLAKKASAALQRSGFWSFDWIFGMGKLDKSRHEAQLHLFERGVIWPLADLAREKVQSGTNALSQPNDQALDAETKRLQGAVLGLLELELCKTNQTWTLKDFDASRDRVLDGLTTFLLADQTDEVRNPILRDLKEAFNATYAKSERLWPPTSAKEPAELTNLVETAFGRISQLQSAQSNLLEERRTRLRDLVARVSKASEDERRFINQIENRDSVESLSESLDSLKKVWGKLAADLKEQQVDLFTTTFAVYASEVINRAQGRQQDFRQKIAAVNGATNGATLDANLIPVLAVRFERLNQQVPSTNQVLSKFQDLAKKAADLDKLVLAAAPTNSFTSADGGQPTEGGPLLSARLQVYTRVLNPELPDAGHCVRDLLETAEQPSETMDKFRKESSKESGIPPLLFLNLSSGNKPYTGVLSEYLDYVRYNNLLKECETRMGKLLSKEKFGIKPPSLVELDPKDVFDLSSAQMEKLNHYDDAWTELRKRWTDLGGGSDDPRIQSTRGAIDRTRREALQSVGEFIKQDLSKATGFPLDDTGASLSKNEVLDAWRQADSWRKAIVDYSKSDAKANNASVIPKPEFEKWSKIITNRLEVFRDLVTKDGGLLKYSIETLWNTESSVLEECIGPSSVKEATEGAGKYKSWEWGNSKLNADDKVSTPKFDADRKLAVRAYTDEASHVQGAVTPQLGSNWPIIELIRESRNGGCSPPPYYVQLKVKGATDKVESTVWFVIKPSSDERVVR